MSFECYDYHSSKNKLHSLRKLIEKSLKETGCHPTFLVMNIEDFSDLYREQELLENWWVNTIVTDGRLGMSLIVIAPVAFPSVVYSPAVEIEIQSGKKKKECAK